MAYDGNQNTNRVDTLTERKNYAKVTDNILNSATLASRLMGNGEDFQGKTFDYPIKITNSQAGQFISGSETLNSAASDTTITLSYAQGIFTQPVIIPLGEAWANSGPQGTVNLQAFKKDEAGGEAKNRIGQAFYSVSSGGILGLQTIVDDGTTTDQVGGQSRTTYTALKGTVTSASSNKISLSQMATLHDNVSSAGIESEEPTIGVTTKSVWSNIESLLAPQVRANYDVLLPVRGDRMLSKEALGGYSGFTSISYRGMPIIKDDACTSGYLYFLNENYLTWKGRSIVPQGFEGVLEKVDLGTPSTTLGVMAAPSNTNGFFYQKDQMVINQGALVGRIWVVGQLVTNQPRRHGVLTGITGI